MNLHKKSYRQAIIINEIDKIIGIKSELGKMKFHKNT